MADVPTITTGDLLKYGIGLAGSLVSLKFLKDTSRTEKLLLVLGGSILSFVATSPVTDYFKVAHAEGLVGFMLGLFGMALTTKAYEVITLLDSAKIAKWFMDRYFPSKKEDKQ